jgi:hypothetical protein
LLLVIRPCAWQVDLIRHFEIALKILPPARVLYRLFHTSKGLYAAAEYINIGVHASLIGQTFFGHKSNPLADIVYAAERQGDSHDYQAVRKIAKSGQNYV